MMKSSIVAGVFTTAVCSTMAQSPVLLDVQIRENAAFDTLPAWYDRTEISVDTTTVINDSLWMAILWISDADSMPDDIGGWYHSGGVCEYVFLMTMDPRTGLIVDYQQIRTACDVDQSIDDVTYYSHRVGEPGIVEVISSRPRRWREGGSDWEELVPFELKWFKVMTNGSVKDMGVGIFTGGPTR